MGVNLPPNTANLTDHAATNLALWRYRRLSWPTIGIAYVVAAACALLYAKAGLHTPDEFQYLAIGQNLAKLHFFSEDGVHPTAWRPPGFPLLVAALWSIWPSVYLIKLVTLSCWAITGLLVTRLAVRFADAAAGYLTAVLYLCYAYLLYAATTLYPQTITGLLVVVSVAMIVQARRLTGVQQTLLLGVTVLQILMIPNCVVVALANYLFAVARGKLRLRDAIIAGSVTALVVFGWCYRNQQEMGGFTFATSMGVALEEGNRDNVTAATAGLDEAAIAAGSFDALKSTDNATSDVSEVEDNKARQRRAIEWVEGHPWQAAELTVGKFAYWFNYENQYTTRISVPLMGLLPFAMAIIYYPVLLGSLMAIGSRDSRRRDFAILSWIIYLGVALTYALFITRLRYRLPFDPLLFAVGPAMLLEFVQGQWQFRKPVE